MNIQEAKLFLVTNGVGTWYVVAKDFTSASRYIEIALNRRDCGYSVDRTVTNVELVAQGTQSDNVSGTSIVNPVTQILFEEMVENS